MDGTLRGRLHIVYVDWRIGGEGEEGPLTFLANANATLRLLRLKFPNEVVKNDELVELIASSMGKH